MSTRTCAVCGTTYSYCPTCERDRFKPSWYMTFHDENCREIWRVLSSYGCELISAEECAKQLEACDLSKKNSFAPAIKDQIEKILPQNKKKSILKRDK